MINLIQPQESNFAKYCLNRRAVIKDLVIPVDNTNWPGICNPSILNDDGKLKLVLRNVNYALNASYYDNKNWDSWGVLHYIIPNKDHAGKHLRTQNFICDIDDDCMITNYNLVKTNKYDKKPKWEFVGHEDARLVRWDGRLYMSGVRRDDNTTGVGRMSLCGIDDKCNEVIRKKIDGPNLGYCEKNWMAITDMPYCYVRTTHPITEIVKVDPKSGKYSTILKTESNLNTGHDMMVRGSSQVIPWKDGKHIALTHTCNLWINELDKKVSRYHFQFVVWDKDWNIEKISKMFTFNDFTVEFSNGLAIKDGKFYIPFALQDNMSFIMKVDEQVIEDFIYDNISEKTIEPDSNIIHNFFMDDKNPEVLNELGMLYYNDKFYAGAFCLLQRAIDFMDENDPELYDAHFWRSRAFANLGEREYDELDFWWRTISIDHTRPEGWMALHLFYTYRQQYLQAYHYAKIAYQLRGNTKIFYDPDIYIREILLNGLFTEDRDKRIKEIADNKDVSDFNNELYDIMVEIVNKQQDVQRIL